MPVINTKPNHKTVLADVMWSGLLVNQGRWTVGSLGTVGPCCTRGAVDSRNSIAKHACRHHFFVVQFTVAVEIQPT